MSQDRSGWKEKWVDVSGPKWMESEVGGCLRTEVDGKRSGWMSQDRSGWKAKWVDVSGPKWTESEVGGCLRTEVDGKRSGWMFQDRSGRKAKWVDVSGPKWTESEVGGCFRTEVDGKRSGWMSQDRSGRKAKWVDVSGPKWTDSELGGCLRTKVDGKRNSAGQQGVRRVPDEQRLYETIMNRYQSSVMPHVPNVSFTLTVAFSLRLNQIVSLDERKQVLTTNVFIDQTWIDPGLAWDPDQFTDVRALRIPADHVWLPDTFVYNNADGGTSGFMRGTYVQIQSNGRVLWPVPLRLRSSCSVQIMYFPFDSQICTLRFGSWIYGLQHLDYEPLTDGLTVDPSTYVNNSEWELVSITMSRSVAPPGGPGDLLKRLGPHPHLTYVLHLKRNTFFYLFNIIVPCVMLSTLNILTFWLPPVSGEKVTLGLSVFLAFSMFMLLIAEEVPATSEAVPVIGAYLCMVMTMTSLSVMMAVVVTNLYHRGRKMRRAPRWLVTVCLDWLARPCCVVNNIPLIASTVDLVEHCQYDVSHKRKSQPSLASTSHLNVKDVPKNTPPPPPPPTPPQTPSFIPTHLQNGGNVRVRAADDLEPVWQERRVSEDAESSSSSESSPRKTASWLEAVRGKSRALEVHPRARNSVVSSCRFSQIPATPDSLLSQDQTGRSEQEEDVWVKRDQVSSTRPPKVLRFTTNHAKAHEDDDNEEEEEEEEEKEMSRNLLSKGSQFYSSEDHRIDDVPFHPQNRRRSRDSGRKAAAGSCSSSSSSRLDPHPTSVDLQCARTMIAEWQQIATVVDRLMFVLYVLTTVIAYIVILIIVPANQPPIVFPDINATIATSSSTSNTVARRY
ncbi:hypothetical protein ACOMHN_009804 [Nucella lapillus]